MVGRSPGHQTDIDTRPDHQLPPHHSLRSPTISQTVCLEAVNGLKTDGWLGNGECDGGPSGQSELTVRAEAL